MRGGGEHGGGSPARQREQDGVLQFAAARRPGGVIELSPFEFLDRLADLIPQPRRHRHRYYGVFAPNHPLRRAVTELAVGNVGKQRDAATGGHVHAGHAAGDCCNAHEKPRSHDTSRRQRPS